MYPLIKSLIVLSLLLLPNLQHAQTIINPQIGITFSELQGEDGEIDLEGRSGLQVGFDLRIGSSSLYFSPGLYYYTQELELRDQILSLEDDSRIHNLRVPLNLGYRLSSRDNIIAFRMKGGVVPSFNLAADDTPDIGFSNDDLEQVTVNANVGLGVDILYLFTVDVGYEFGISDVVDDFQSRNDQLVLSVGVRLAR